ncbi:MAG: CRISPR-associated helicase Cas3' [Ruminococcus sp.]|nr:CRISPR-associated helicase Cas3' [Ruminococcus sp.]MDD6710332.1 CRISPR-associated helicase Cas3' [Ruminococcus sp.]
MDYHNALAKPDETIEQHTDKLLECAKVLYDLGYIKSEQLYKDLLVACNKHDMGKMNSQFQIRIKRRSKYNYEIEVPHAVLSIFFVDESECNDYTSVLFAVLFHHYHKESPMDVFHDDRQLIEGFLSELNFQQNDYNKMRRKLNKVKKIFQTNLNDKQKQYAVLLKGLLHKCDYSASANIPCEKKNDFLLESIEDWRSGKFQYNTLQEFCIANRNENIMVTAPTGMGKTEAGLLWCGDNKCFFVLPLKTAINAMYGRIKELANDVEAEDVYKSRVALVHSDMKSYYLKDANDKDAYYDFNYEELSRQFCLPVTVCTPDQIFDFVLKYPGYEYKLAISSYSKFIIDEIQMYSPDILAAIIYAIKMIHIMGGKVAVLTATLPPFVKEELIKIFGDDVQLADFSSEGILRHNVKVFDDTLETDDVVEIVNETNSDTVKKYLVVCNTVKTANRIYKELSESNIDAEINLFHANFIKKDRMKKEEEIMGASKKKLNEMTKPEIWISTSVVEASLDIDFDILITELSDLFSLFQRFGRTNRKGKKDFSNYNCYVFTELQDRADSFIDLDIHNLSKDAIVTVDGVLTEQEKNYLIEKYLSVEKVQDTDYYKDYCKFFKNYEDEYDYLNSSKDSLRNIDRMDAIPKCVYDENIDMINENLEKINSTDVDKDSRMNATEEILKLTVSISMFRCRKHDSGISVDMKYRRIPVIDCNYSFDSGLDFEFIEKPIDDESKKITFY